MFLVLKGIFYIRAGAKDFDGRSFPELDEEQPLIKFRVSLNA